MIALLVSIWETVLLSTSTDCVVSNPIDCGSTTHGDRCRWWNGGIQESTSVIVTARKYKYSRNTDNDNTTTTTNDNDNNNSVSDLSEQCVVMDDVCAHRLVPLSEGLDESNQLCGCCIE